MSASWFPHDATASTDAKILRLRAKYGWEGYGLYFATLEWMYQSADAKIDADDLPALCLFLGKRRDFVGHFLDFCGDLGLFSKDNGFFYSHRLRAEKMKEIEKSSKAKRAVAIRESKRSSNRSSDDTSSDEPTTVPNPPTHPPVDEKLDNDIKRQFGKMGIDNPGAYLAKLYAAVGNDRRAIRKAWVEWKRGTGIESPGDFFARAVHWHKNENEMSA